MSDFDPGLLARDFPCAFHPGIQYNRIYWPIELESLCEWSAGLDPFTKVFLGSVARRVERSLDLPAQGIRLTVIEMEYDRGSYPCVAVYTYERDSRGCSVISEETAYAILCELRSTLSKTTLGKLMRQTPCGGEKPANDEVQKPAQLAVDGTNTR